jgi:hypothetical protein
MYHSFVLFLCSGHCHGYKRGTYPTCFPSFFYILIYFSTKLQFNAEFKLLYIKKAYERKYITLSLECENDNARDSSLSEVINAFHKHDYDKLLLTLRGHTHSF